MSVGPCNLTWVRTRTDADTGRDKKLSGKVLAVAGIFLVGLTLRMAVTSTPPLITAMGEDMEINAAIIGVMGMLPTATFAIFGFLTPYVVRWASLEKLVLIALAAAALGQLGRAAAPDTTSFMALSVLALAGLGAGNVLLPPLVKEYFPNRIGLMTALYVTSLSLGTAIPAQFAVPVADSSGWRLSIAIWAGVSVIAALPWLALGVGRGRRRRRDAGASGASPGTAAEASTGEAAAGAAARKPRINLWRSPLAIGLAFMFGCTSLNTYAMFAWLPQMLTEAGLGRAEAGSMLSLFAILGLPLSLTVPLLAARVRNPMPAVVVFLACFVAGYLGLLLAPGNGTWLWVVLAGIGPGTFPLALVLINLRTRTHAGAGALSGFSQGIGYALACTGPLLFGIFHDLSGGWMTSFIFLGVTLVALAAGSVVACRPKMLEDHPGVVT